MNPGPMDYIPERCKDYLTKKPVGNKFSKAKKEFWLEKNVIAKKSNSPGFKYSPKYYFLSKKWSE